LFVQDEVACREQKKFALRLRRAAWASASSMSSCGWMVSASTTSGRIESARPNYDVRPRAARWLAAETAAVLIAALTFH
jgi:hypothetical protein